MGPGTVGSARRTALYSRFERGRARGEAAGVGPHVSVRLRGDVAPQLDRSAPAGEQLTRSELLDRLDPVVGSAMATAIAVTRGRIVMSMRRTAVSAWRLQTLGLGAQLLYGCYCWSEERHAATERAAQPRTLSVAASSARFQPCLLDPGRRQDRGGWGHRGAIILGGVSQMFSISAETGPGSNF
jgi:hypothetical protein